MRIFRQNNKNYELDTLEDIGIHYKIEGKILKVKHVNGRYYNITNRYGKKIINDATDGHQEDIMFVAPFLQQVQQLHREEPREPRELERINFALRERGLCPRYICAWDECCSIICPSKPNDQGWEEHPGLGQSW
jgi:hypothetical protein